MSGKGSSPGGGWALEQAPQGSGHGPKLLEFKKRLDNALSHTVWFLGGPVWSQELDSMILMGLFQLRISYDSINTLLRWMQRRFRGTINSSLMVKYWPLKYQPSKLRFKSVKLFFYRRGISVLVFCSTVQLTYSLLQWVLQRLHALHSHVKARFDQSSRFTALSC